MLPSLCTQLVTRAWVLTVIRTPSAIQSEDVYASQVTKETEEVVRVNNLLLRGYFLLHSNLLGGGPILRDNDNGENYLVTPNRPFENTVDEKLMFFSPNVPQKRAFGSNKSYNGSKKITKEKESGEEPQVFILQY